MSFTFFAYIPDSHVFIRYHIHISNSDEKLNFNRVFGGFGYPRGQCCNVLSRNMLTLIHYRQNDLVVHFNINDSFYNDISTGLKKRHISTYNKNINFLHSK